MSESPSGGPGNGPSDLLNARLWWRQIRTASGLLLRLNPWAAAPAEPARALASAARAFPLVGAALGLTGGLAYAILSGIGLSPLLAALAGIGALVVATGALHETQLSRFAERLSGAAEARLGAAGVIALLMTLGARIATIADLERPGPVIAALVCAGALSRATLPALVRYLPQLAARAQAAAQARDPAEAEGGEEKAASPARPHDAPAPLAADVLTGAGIAAFLSLIALGWAGLLAALAGAAGAFALGLLTRQRVPGNAPEALGAAQQSAEILFLVALAAVK